MLGEHHIYFSAEKLFYVNINLDDGRQSFGVSNDTRVSEAP